MSNVIASSNTVAIIGTGQTGISIAHYLQGQNRHFMFVDTRQNPPNEALIAQCFPGVACQFGPLSNNSFDGVQTLYVSPGVDLKEPSIQAAIDNGTNIKGDIQLFVEQTDKPIVAITGSNGKSTVTTLIGEMLTAAGKNAVVGGNIGKPVLGLLENDTETDVYALELSSFQLETTQQLNADVAVLLNLSADHMDRYDRLEDYLLAKQRIFFGAKKVVVNRQDPLSRPPISQDMQVISFGLDVPDLNQFGVITDDGQEYLVWGLDKLLPVSALKIRGKHNVANALAALALGKAIDLPMPAMLEALQTFKGLPHRCQWVAEIDGIEFFNDSKGTNVGACIAAIEGLARNEKNIILIAGGEGKGADFNELAPALSQHVKHLVAIGTDGLLLEKVAKNDGVNTFCAKQLSEAVNTAKSCAEEGDIVLLSPACASFDMFDDYQDRGNQFCRIVEGLVQ